jgi:hypothetical protein
MRGKKMKRIVSQKLNDNAKIKINVVDVAANGALGARTSATMRYIADGSGYDIWRMARYTTLSILTGRTHRNSHVGNWVGCMVDWDMISRDNDITRQYIYPVRPCYATEIKHQWVRDAIMDIVLPLLRYDAQLGRYIPVCTHDAAEQALQDIKQYYTDNAGKYSCAVHYYTQVVDMANLVRAIIATR